MPGSSPEPPVANGRLPVLALLLGVAALVLLALTNAGEIRARAEAALGRGMPPREAELARGFVLGQDERIDRATKEDFRRSGLAHLLAVSGQNVALLALLAMPVLAAFGLPLRVRLVWILGLIAVYVPLAGAGPSVQRAGIMGALSVLATLASRRRSRFRALLVAAAATLAIEPAFAADVGWQLSFAALLGILALAAPLRAAIAPRLGAGEWQRALAEGAAMTIAATVATAPLVAFHFGAFSTTTLVANLLALPAVAPAMWLGMVAAAAGQVPGFPVEVVNSLAAPLLAYVAQIAAWCGRPSWASLEVRIGTAGLVASYLTLAAGAVGVARVHRRLRMHALRSSPATDWPKKNARRPVLSRRPGARRVIVIAAVGLVAVGAVWSTAPDGGAVATPPAGLRVTVLDVGQGDAILLQSADGEAILVDTGPPGAGLVGQLRESGVGRLDAAVVTHDQSDHAGGLGELLGAVPVGRLLYAVLGRRALEAGRAAGAPARRIAAGDEIRAGALRLEVLWPPRELLGSLAAPEDPNLLSLVLLLRWHDFSMLLSADAEAEATPLDPGPVDALKVAHHGSEDAGLAALLERTGPSVAIVSAGEGNPFGHPAAATLAALAEHGVRTLRTDRDGTVVLEVTRGSFRVGAGG